MREKRTAKIRSTADSPVGACIYLDPEDLENLGVDPTNSSGISYRISPEGKLLINQAATDD